MHPGPINRGVEIDGRVADSPRLADPRAGALRGGGADGGAARPAGGGQPRARSGRRSHEHPLLPATACRQPLCSKAACRGDRCVTVTVEDGVIARIQPSASSSRAVLAPAFVDPHVHLRSPGREDEETIASGTAAAAAGGYCAILAMPNTDPVVDSAAVLGSARRGRAAGGARADRLHGRDLETARRRGADRDGRARRRGRGGLHRRRPSRRERRPTRRALEYGAITGRTLALHCEEPTLTRDGQVHDAVSAELGLARLSLARPRARWSSASSRWRATRQRGPLHL